MWQTTTRAPSRAIRAAMPRPMPRAGTGHDLHFTGNNSLRHCVLFGHPSPARPWRSHALSYIELPSRRFLFISTVLATLSGWRLSEHR
jgi:hypothetical protein